MRYLFGPGGADRLGILMASKPLLGFDFDGTLAPLAEHPDQASLSPTTKTLFTRLAERAKVVVISGRARADVIPRVASARVSGVAGNHGIEPFGQTSEVESLVAEWHRSLERDLVKWPGLIIEDKRYSLTVDYRHAPDLEAARHAIQEAARHLPRARLLGGRHADFNIAPEGAPNKGTALRAFVTEFGCTSALYVGDDRTDEDVFQLDMTGLLSVRVGRRRQSAAAYFLEEQPEIDRLLDVLLGLVRS
jgi:trehalose 6-phosphate phosphatase